MLLYKIYSTLPPWLKSCIKNSFGASGHKISVIDKLKKVSKMLGMKNWLLKFDLIVTKKDYVVLDVGMDPPNRMREDWKKKNKNFINFYLNLYLKY